VLAGEYLEEQVEVLSEGPLVYPVYPNPGVAQYLGAMLRFLKWRLPKRLCEEVKEHAYLENDSLRELMQFFCQKKIRQEDEAKYDPKRVLLRDKFLHYAVHNNDGEEVGQINITVTPFSLLRCVQAYTFTDAIVRKRATRLIEQSKSIAKCDVIRELWAIRDTVTDQWVQIAFRSLEQLFPESR
jgi:hypothetical protein